MQYSPSQARWNLWPHLGAKDVLGTNVPEYVGHMNMCADAIYIDELLFGQYGYSFQDGQLDIQNSINRQPIDWPLGALLYQLLRVTGP